MRRETNLIKMALQKESKQLKMVPIYDPYQMVVPLMSGATSSSSPSFAIIKLAYSILMGSIQWSMNP